MKNQKVRAMLTRLFRLCMVLLLLPSLLLVAPLQARAVEWTVTESAGVYTAADPTNPATTVEVFPITLDTGNTADWSIAGVTAGGDTYSDGARFYAPAGSADVTLNYLGTDLITAGEIGITGATVSGSDKSFTATLTDITAATILTITVTPPTITLTFPPSEFYTVHRSPDPEGTKYSNLSGAAFKFELWPNLAEYYFSDINAVMECSISSGGGTPQAIALDTLGLNMNSGPIAIEGTIPGANLTADSLIEFKINETKLTKLVTLTEANHGVGYQIKILQSALPGAGGNIWLSVIVDAAYSNSALTFTAGSYEIRNEGGQSIEGGAKKWDFKIVAPTDGTFPPDIPVTVSGIVPNAPPPSGGGDSGGGYEEPAIRVENELNKDDVKSDTTLWPAHTTESGGVSTTTVTDAELKALLELARQHAKDTEGIPGEGLKEGIFSIEDLRPNSQNNSYVLELTGDQLHTLEQENWDRLTVQTPAGSFSLYSEALAQAGAEITDGNQPVRITLQRLDHENRPGVDASLTVNKNQVTSFETPYGVRIVVPYTPAPGEDVNALIIDYIHEDGTVERVTECHYDPEAGGVVFFTTHLSKFGVAYRPAAFADVTAKHWANPYVTFLASRGVISGYGDKKFRPDDLATRGETIAMLTKALSAVKCPKKPIQVYTDVKLSSSISGASNWLYFNNLAPFFTTGTKLKPGAPVAKQDVAALVNNITDGVGLRLRSRGLDTGYTDLGELADYAKPAVVRLTAAGILPMTSNFKFNPKTNLNRGELAQITATLLSNL